MKALLLLATILLPPCGFQTRMVASATADGKFWVIEQPLRYEDTKSGKMIEVPRGFATDFASVPRLFWSAFPPCGDYTPSAVVHDYLYWEQPPGIDRKSADDLLLTAMEESDVDWSSRQSIYRAVRLGGQRAWDTNAKLKRAGTIRMVPEKFMNYPPNETWEQLEKRIRLSR